MSILTRDELREHVETSLSDDALDRVLAAAELTLEESCGVFVPPGSGSELPDPVTETVFRPGTRILPLTQPVALDPDTGDPLVDSVMEYAWGDTTGTEVVAADYLVRPDGLDRGPNVWPYRTVVTYTPANRLALRQMAIVELCRIEIAFDPVLASQTIGDWSESYRDVDRESATDAAVAKVCSPRPFA